jgi:UDP-hydrolysing UDP-N-acetyl-D-glucosamine 2-epimerase
MPLSSTTRTLSRPQGALAAPPPWLRRICCLSTSRADAGIYRPLLAALAAQPGWDVSVLAAGTHGDPAFGHDPADLGHAGGCRRILLPSPPVSDSPAAVASAAARGLEACAHALAREQPDLVFVLGDRVEMLAAALAVVVHRVALAHLHGGDTTLGACDEACRHALTRLSHLHFPALAQHAATIAGLGEERWRIRAVGALALDSVATFTPEPAGELARAIGLDLSQGMVVVAFYPETLAEDPPRRQIDAVLRALEGISGHILLIGPNADVGHGDIRQALLDFAARRPATSLFTSLPQVRFWSCLAHARLLVGNTSAGIIEAASFRLPVVNVGRRQAGRLRPANVIDAPADSAAIQSAIARAWDTDFLRGLAGLRNPYGDGRAAERIVEALKELPPREDLLHKPAPRPRAD